MVLTAIGRLRHLSTASASFASASGKTAFRRWWEQKPVTNPAYAEPDYFDKEAQKVEFSSNYIEKLSALYNERQTTRQDLKRKQDDQLIEHKQHWLPEIAPFTPKVAYRSIEALRTAPEPVKKICSISFGSVRDEHDYWIKEFIDQVCDNELDDQTLEAKIARQTALIRAFDKLRVELEDVRPKIPLQKQHGLRQAMNQMIDKRRKNLRLLRQRDGEAFNRVLREFKIAYRLPPLIEDLPVQTRIGWIEQHARLKCEGVKERKKKTYHAKLKAQQADFMKKKAEQLKTIDEEETSILKELQAIRTEEGEELKVVGKYRPRTIDQWSENLIHKDYYRENVMNTK